MRILLFHGRGIISWAIRIFTRGDYSHAALQLSNGEVWESWQGSGKHFWRNSGVRCLPGGLKEGTIGVSCFILVDPSTDGPDPLMPSEEEILRAWLKSKEGTPYDLAGVWRFVSRSRKGSADTMFCSDLVFEGLKHVGRLLFRETRGDEVPPDLIKRSLALRLEGGNPA